MSNAKRGLRALGLSLSTAMGLMAFVAVGAQAAWDVDGKEITTNAPFTGNLVAGTEALLLIPTQNLVIHCNSILFKAGSEFLPLPVLDADVITQYDGCKTLVKEVESAGCKPEILQLKSRFLQILHSGKAYILAEPLTGTSFTQVHYNEETCALPPLPSVTGSVVYECTSGGVQLSCAHPLVKQRIRPAPPALFPSDTLKYGLNAMQIHEHIELFLTGPLQGSTISLLV